jgi:lysylphosphatidylglycerol synthetase-like protein (DUF2156 family)
MNPCDFILLLLSLGFAVISLLVHGWTLNGTGPVLLCTAGGFWQIWMQWLRHQSYLRHKNEDFIPGTQHLAISAWLGWSLTTFAALIWSFLTLKELQP